MAKTGIDVDTEKLATALAALADGIEEKNIYVTSYEVDGKFAVGEPLSFTIEVDFDLGEGSIITQYLTDVLED